MLLLGVNKTACVTIGVIIQKLFLVIFQCKLPCDYAENRQ